jgi:hypothetical protein
MAGKKKSGNKKPAKNTASKPAPAPAETEPEG